MDRRRFLITGAAAVVTARSLAQDSGARVAKLTLYPNKIGFTIPENFVGLSYETQQLSDAHFFSPANQGLIAQFRALAPHGVLRLGGNTSDYAFFKSPPKVTPPPRHKRPYKVGDPNPNPIGRVVRPRGEADMRVRQSGDKNHSSQEDWATWFSTTCHRERSFATT